MKERKQHETARSLFFKQEDAHQVLGFFKHALTPQTSLSDEKVTFFSPKALNLLEQVIILQHINTYRRMFKMGEVQ